MKTGHYIKVEWLPKHELGEKNAYINFEGYIHEIKNNAIWIKSYKSWLLLNHKHYVWKGHKIDVYFGNLQEGYWIPVSKLKYWLLRLGGYITYKIKH
jgi:hypothetical protein